jgi:hypothetical protein
MANREKNGVFLNTVNDNYQIGAGTGSANIVYGTD